MSEHELDTFIPRPPPVALVSATRAHSETARVPSETARSRTDTHDDRDREFDTIVARPRPVAVVPATRARSESDLAIIRERGFARASPESLPRNFNVPSVDLEAPRVVSEERVDEFEDMTWPRFLVLAGRVSSSVHIFLLAI